MIFVIVILNVMLFNTLGLVLIVILFWAREILYRLLIPNWIFWSLTVWWLLATLTSTSVEVGVATLDWIWNRPQDYSIEAGKLEKAAATPGVAV